MDACATKIDEADYLIRKVQQSQNPSPEIDAQAMAEQKALPDYKQAMSEADEAIRNRVYQELSGEA